MTTQIKLALTSTSEAKSYSISRFAELTGIRYLKHTECDDWRLEQWLRQRCAKADKKDKIGDLARWLGKFHAKAIASAEVPDVTVRWMNEKMGYGVFANKAFAQWDFIGEYTGVVRPRRFFFPQINDYCFMYPREWFSLKALTIDSEKEGNFTRFINHSDYPNLESVSVYYDGLLRIIFRTIKPIAPGTELTYDYGEIYWRARQKIEESIPS